MLKLLVLLVFVPQLNVADKDLVSIPFNRSLYFLFCCTCKLDCFGDIKGTMSFFIPINLFLYQETIQQRSFVSQQITMASYNPRLRNKSHVQSVVDGDQKFHEIELSGMTDLL